MNWEPYKHQSETLERYLQGRNFLNASQPGTGKTPPTVEHVKRMGGRATVVAPSYMCLTWQREFARFAGMEAGIYPDISKPVTIISADSIHKCSEAFQQLNVLVVDESDMFCNIKTRRTKALHHYVRTFKPKQVILLTGTPLRSRVSQLWSLLVLLDYGNGAFLSRYPTEFMFNMHFCEIQKIKMGNKEFTKFHGIKNADQLRDHLRKWHFRYLLSQIHDMPSITHKLIEVDQELNDLDLLVNGDPETELQEVVEGWERLDLSAVIPEHAMRAKAASACAKIPATVAYARRMLGQEAGPLVIFSDHREPVAQIATQLGTQYRVSVITGDVSPSARDRIVQDFQAGKYDVLVATIPACRTGVTLTRASHAIFNDLSYDPSSNVQAEGRIRRISQQSPCFIHHIVTKGIDRRIRDLLHAKSELVEKVFG